MTRIMRDSVDVSKIPFGGTDIAAGYEDGTFDNVSALAARFPHIPHCLIDVTGQAPVSDARDWENGDKAGSLEEWVQAHNKARRRSDAVIYCNRSTILEVRRLTGSQVLGRDYWLWVATLDGFILTPADQPGLIACQDKGAAQNGANYDESVVFADWWLIGPAPAPKPQGPIQAPPGQWNDPRAWTWNANRPVAVSGYGLDGKPYAFSLDTATGHWGKA